MKKVITIVFLTLLFITTSIPAMLSNNKKQLNPAYSNEYLVHLKYHHTVKAQEAERYNQSHPLMTLPIDILTQVCHETNEDKLKSLEKTIKTFMNIRAACATAYNFLTFESIGTLCKSYSPETRIQLFKNLMKSNCEPHHEVKHLPALILLCSDIDTGEISEELNCLLVEAVKSNETQRVTTLFKYHANPNGLDINPNSPMPIFFYAKTITMAQEFIKNKVNIHALYHWSDTNVLWEVVKNKYPAELLALYLAYNVNPRIIRSIDCTCLLHAFTWTSLDINDNFFKKVELVLDAIPDMVSIANLKGETPLDYVYAALKMYKQKNLNTEMLEKIIDLFKHYGAKTAQELEI